MNRSSRWVIFLKPRSKALLKKLKNLSQSLRREPGQLWSWLGGLRLIAVLIKVFDDIDWKEYRLTKTRLGIIRMLACLLWGYAEGEEIYLARCLLHVELPWIEAHAGSFSWNPEAKRSWRSWRTWARASGENPGQLWSWLGGLDSLQSSSRCLKTLIRMGREQQELD